MISISRFLKQPCALRIDTAYDIKLSLVTGLFVFLFLLAFQPFGLSTIRPELRYYLIAGYSLVCTLVLLLNLLVAPTVFTRMFRDENWTMLRRILWQLWIVLSIGVGNYLFACLFDALFDFYNLGLVLYLYLQLITLLIAIIPIVVINILSHNYLLKTNLRASEEISARLDDQKPVPDGAVVRPEITLRSDHERDEYPFSPETICYITSEGNYSRVVWIGEKKGSVLIRSSLKRIESQLAGCELFFKCHRAYIVNIRRIRKVSGNAQGLQLTLEGLDRPVPVARGYTKEFRRRLGIA